MVFKSYGTVSSELRRTDEAIRTAGYTGPIHFRPPYGRKLLILPLYLDRHEIKSITWDVAPESYGQTVEDSQIIAERAVTKVSSGSILLLHVMFASRQDSMEAVPKIIHRLRSKGYRFVTVSELLRKRGKEAS